MLMSYFFRAVLPSLVRLLKLPKRVISRDDGTPYLERYFLLGDPGGIRYFDEQNRSLRWWQRLTTRLPCVYLHRFVASDSDPELHNHPWQATSLILSGGYMEQRRMVDPYSFTLKKGVQYMVIDQTFFPGQVNRLAPDTFHRVTLLEDDCWTAIKIGSKVKSWGFWSEQTGEFVPWREHAARRERAIAQKRLTDELLGRLTRGGQG